MLIQSMQWCKDPVPQEYGSYTLMSFKIVFLYLHWFYTYSIFLQCFCLDSNDQYMPIIGMPKQLQHQPLSINNI